MRIVIPHSTVDDILLTSTRSSTVRAQTPAGFLFGIVRTKVRWSCMLQYRRKLAARWTAQSTNLLTLRLSMLLFHQSYVSAPPPHAPGSPRAHHQRQRNQVLRLTASPQDYTTAVGSPFTLCHSLTSAWAPSRSAALRSGRTSMGGSTRCA